MYIPSLKDNLERICVVGTVETDMTVFGERKTSAEFITPAIRIDRANSVLIRIAGTMKRAGKAQFEGRLPMREVVTVCLENGFLILKATSVVLFRAQF
jgi:hypothetical protein